MKWLAIVPLNFGGHGKTRLAARLSAAQRGALIDRMARRVLRQLSMTPSIERIRVLSPVRPPFAADVWIRDAGRGLNAELVEARGQLSSPPTVFIHADLPFLAAHEVQALLEAAERSGAALAPDRREEGTNALALIGAAAFTPAFGRDSFSAHRGLLPDAAVVRSPGISFDIDAPEDLELALANEPGLLDAELVRPNPLAPGR
jgi:2-phospho-L-lactate/phosphoenolpyruvate guanylyltransferase